MMKRRRSKDDSRDQLYLYSPKFAENKLSLYSRAGNLCDVPITFRHLSDLVDLMLKGFDAHTDLFTNANKLIYKKACFLMAEIKLGRCFYRKPAHLRDISEDKIFGSYSNRDISVPYPLAFYLNSIGRFTNQEMNFVPVPAITENHIADACYSCMPYTFADILNQLANGVEIEKVSIKARASLKSLPAIDWVIIKNDVGVETHIQLSPESVEFWLKPRPENAPDDQLRDLNCTHDDFRIFQDINNFILIRCSDRTRKIVADFTKDNRGNASQLVRFGEYSDSNLGVNEWYTMYDVCSEYKKLGIAFGFGHFEEKVQASVAVGDLRTAHTTGQDYIFNFLRSLILPIMEGECARDSD